MSWWRRWWRRWLTPRDQVAPYRPMTPEQARTIVQNYYPS